MKVSGEIDQISIDKNIKVTNSILDAFDLLKTPKVDLKLVGGAKIISQLQGIENEKDIQYVLKRLVRSLGANAPELRTGYFATLVALLMKNNQITPSQLLELVKKELHSIGSSKSEVGDVSLGHILVCGALFRSKCILRSTQGEQKEVIELLFTASKKKSYLSTISYLILLDFVEQLNEEQFLSIVWTNIRGEFKKDLKDHNLDSLYFLLKVSNKFPATVKLRKLIGSKEIFCEDHVHEISDKLMTGIDFSTINHPIFKEVGTAFANSPHLLLFWTSGIDTRLVKHNRNREMVAVNMLITILNNIHSNFEVIPELISINFFKLFMDWFKGLQTASKVRNKRDNEDDHKIMVKKQKELLNALAAALKSHDTLTKTRIDILKKLLFYPGEMNFTEITGTSIVKSIISDLDREGIKKMAKLFKGVLLNTSKKLIKEELERSWYNNERLKAAEFISYLVIHETVKDDIEFKLTYMKLLLCFGFFKIGGDENVAVSQELAGAIKTCFYRCFSSRLSDVNNLVEILSSLCNFINTTLQKEVIRTKLEKQFTKDNMESWEMLTSVCEIIETNKAKSKVDKVFLILLYQLGLFLFSEPAYVKMAKSSIKELKSCYEHYNKEKKKKLKKISQLDLTNSEPEWIEVLVELLLSILSNDSSILRSIVQCVFSLLWEYLTPTSIEQIVSVLDPESESSPLSQDNDSEDDKSSSDSDEDKESSVGNDEDCDDTDTEIEDDENEDMKTPDQLRLAVQQALGAAVPDTDTESMDADLIDEEEGKKLDTALAEAFKQYHEGKTKKLKKERKDKKALSDFRIRVLDLLDIYLDKDPSMDICLGMIIPLTRSLEFCIQDNQFSELERRLRKTIRILTKIRKFSSVEGVSLDNLCDYLKSIIEKGSRSHFMFQALGDVITHFTTFIIHCSQRISAVESEAVLKIKPTSPLTEIFKEALQNYFNNRNCLLPIIFFHNILQLEWDGVFELVPIITENIFNNNVRQFRKNEGIKLITGFYHALKRFKLSAGQISSNLNYLEKQLYDTVIEKLKLETNFEVKNIFFVLLKKLVNTMKMFHESCHIEVCIDFKGLVDAIESCKNVVIVKADKHPQNVQNEEKNKKSKKIKKKRKHEISNGHTNIAEKKIKL